MVEARSQPLLRMTRAALPVKAANSTLPSTPWAMWRARVVLPVPAKPNSRKVCGVPPLPGLALSQSATALSAASWCGVNTVMACRVKNARNICQEQRGNKWFLRVGDAAGSADIGFGAGRQLLQRALERRHLGFELGDAVGEVAWAARSRGGLLRV